MSVLFPHLPHTFTTCGNPNESTQGDLCRSRQVSTGVCDLELELGSELFQILFKGQAISTVRRDAVQREGYGEELTI